MKIAELRELLAKATARPWKVTNGGLGIEGQESASTDYDPLVIGGVKAGKGMCHWPSYGISSIPGRKEGEANASLMVVAVNNLSALLDVAEAADKLLNELRHMDGFKEMHDLRAALSALQGGTQ